MSAGGRMRRVDEAVREVIAEAVTGIADPRLGFVTFTEVSTSPDLRHAKVFVSVLGTDEERANSIAALSSAAGLLQGRINAELRLKRTPTLEFVLDETADTAARLEGLLSSEVDGDD